jgi:hypothetical protein
MVDLPIEPIALLGLGRHSGRQPFAIDRGLEEPIVSPVPLGSAQIHRAHPTSVSRRRVEPLAPLRAERSLEQSPETGDGKRRLAGRADRQLQGAAPNACRQMKGAVLGHVRHVDPDAGVTGIAKDTLVDVSIVGRGKHERGGGGVTRPVRTPPPLDLPGRRQVAQRLHGLGRHHGHASALLNKSLDLAESDTATTHHETGPARHIQHHRVHPFALPTAPARM